MISSKKRQDILFWSLISLVHFDSIINKLKRVNHKSNTIQKLPFSSFLQYISIKSFFITFWNNIPILDSSSVTVIERVEPHIFNMPTKSRKHHPHVDPRNCDSTYFFIVFLSNFQDRVWRFIHIVEVEVRCSIVKVFIGCSDTFMKRKT